MRASSISTNFYQFLAFLWIAHDLIFLANCATVRSFPRYDYGGQQHEKFIEEALGRSSPGSARLLAELFGGFELGLEYSDSQAIITVGGAATKCQHQSPCYDNNCKACYDPLLRIHGKCGGASYFTCRGSLPRDCMPYTCTYRASTSRAGKSINDEAVFIKKFPRYEDVFCLGVEERSRSLKMDNALPVNMTDTIGGNNLENFQRSDDDPEWVMPVPDAVTPCKGYDTCIHMDCAKCYDPYLGSHTTCGKMTYYDCNRSLPSMCRPVKCTDSDVREIFPMIEESVATPRSDDGSLDVPQLMVRNFEPLGLTEGRKKCV